MSNKHYFTSESVTEGHPDKIADQISDAVLDAVIAKDSRGHVACETFVTTGLALVGGETKTSASIEVRNIVEDVIRDIGYLDASWGFWPGVAILNTIHDQSPDIAQGVDKVDIEEQGAGDQGLMFGYASDETEEYMPLSITLAHKLSKGLADARKNKTISYLRPDGKTQVTIEYEDEIPKRIDTIIIAAQHNPEPNQETIEQDIKEKIIEPLCGNLVDSKTKYLINGTGRFVVGGPHGDTGLTGRKLIVDTYGGVGRHGGGSFSGKDPSKVDRSASYAARYIAKNIIAAGWAKKVELQIAYCIGVAKPVSIYVNTFGTGTIPESKITENSNREFDILPASIIKNLNLLRPIYRKTSNYGHFGRNLPEFTWEKTNLF